MIEQLPELEAKLDKGCLNLTNLTKANQFFRENKIEGNGAKLEVISKIENMSTRECDKELHRLSGKDAPTIKDKKKRISNNKTRYSFTLSDNTAEAVDQVKGLIHKTLSMDLLIKFMADKTIEVLKKEKFKLNKSKASLPAPNVKRNISAAIKKQVYLRDQCCSSCGGTHRLQYDHRLPFAMGGKSTEENLRLLCFNCNQRSRIRQKLKGPQKQA